MEQILNKVAISNNKSLAVLIPLTMLLWLLNIYVEGLYHWLTGAYLSTLEKTISYKLLLQINFALLWGLMLCLAFLYLQSKLKNNINLNSVPEDSYNNLNLASEIDKEQSQRKLLQYLAEDEKIILRLYIDGNKKQVQISFRMPGTQSLVANEILYLTEQSSKHGVLVYSISEWAWKILKEEPRYLK